MLKTLQNIHPFVFVIVATIFEVSGDAIVRTAIYNNTGVVRIGLMILAALFLFGYGFFLNLAPVDFGQLVGFYIATLFINWQIISFIAFKTTPTLPIMVGGLFVVTGGLIIAFWKV